MTDWFSDAYWHWRNVFYFRFSEYNDDIDRGAFFEELNYGWYQMYADDEFWGRSRLTLTILHTNNSNNLKNKLKNAKKHCVSQRIVLKGIKSLSV